MGKTVALLLLACLPGIAQFPDKFTNLQVLPKSIPAQDLMDTMRGFCFSLGVRCEHCHAAQHNFASDEKATKKTARLMLRMVDSINRDYIAKTSSASAATVGCVTCHRGLSRPRTLTAVLSESLDQKDIPSTIALYGELKKQYYGSGEYDFSERSLNLLAEALLRDNKAKEAIAIMQLNAEANNPLSGWGIGILAAAYAQGGETAKAKGEYRRLVQLEPDNESARKQLEKLEKTAP